MSRIFVIFAFLITLIRNKGSSTTEMLVSVIIPAFNESNTVQKVIEVVKEMNIVDEVIVVDDGSSDNTAEISKAAGARVIKHNTNLGKGTALQTGLKHSKGDIVAFIDADITNLTSKQIEKIIKPILEGKADITKTKFKRKAGRVTELTAKPLLNFFFPELKFEQPLSGQFAAIKSLIKGIKFEEDYGVDIGIVLDADVRGLRIKEVDIGQLEHTHSSTNGLNKMANQVVRTIVTRAVEYGRVSMMDTLGKYIRMSILGLSLTSLGLFSMFFINKIPLWGGLTLFIVGLVIAIFYTFKLLKKSFKVLSKSDRKSPAVKSFLYMHFQILLSAMILVAMIFTFVGSAHISNDGISIQPVSSNLVWNKQGVQLEFRGPYQVDSALSKNEFNIIRTPAKAMNTLGLKSGDKIYMDNTEYVINETSPGEENVFRMSEDARLYLGLSVGEIILDSDLRKKFSKPYIEKTLSIIDNPGNLTLNEGMFLLSQDKTGRTVNIYVDNKKVAATSGVFDDGYYSIYINNVKYDTIYVDNEGTKAVTSTYWGKNKIKIEIAGQTVTNLKFANSDSGRFLDISI